MFRGLTALTFAAAIAPFIFFALLFLMVLGIATVTMGPVIMAFIAWMTLSRWARRAAEKTREDAVIEARVIRESAPAYPPEAYAPPAHFDLLLQAKHDIGRIRGAAGAIADGGIARQFRVLAERADAIHARLQAEPVKLGLARRFLASYLPRAADLASGYQRFAGDEAGKADRRAKLLDVLYRLETAMKEQESGLDAPELSRIDADLRILTDDLKGYEPAFRHAPAPIIDRVEAIVSGAKGKKP